MIAQLAVNGLAVAAAYVLVALGFVLVINATGAVNFAQGDLVVAGGYAAIVLGAVSGLPGVVLLPLVMVVLAGLGWLVARSAYFPLADRPPVAVFVSTIAVGVILQHGLNGAFGPAPRVGPALAAGPPLDLLGLVVPRQALAVIVTAAVLIVGLHLLFHHTAFGRRLRATAQDPEMARALGIPVRRMIAAAFALSAALAGAAGLLLADLFFVRPTDGTDLMVKAYIAVTIGGWGSFSGAALGAVIVAAFELVGARLVSYPVAEALLYVTLLAILMVRPRGLLGEPADRRS